MKCWYEKEIHVVMISFLQLITQLALIMKPKFNLTLVHLCRVMNKYFVPKVPSTGTLFTDSVGSFDLQRRSGDM